MAIDRVVRNTKLANLTAAAASEWAAPVAEKLEALLHPYLEEGEGMPNVLLLQKLIGRLLADREKQLKESDDQSYHHQVAASTRRNQRDEAAEILKEELRVVRFFLDQTKGRGEGARQGIGEGLSYMAPHFLARTGSYIANLLDVFEERAKRSDSLPRAATLARSIREKTAALELALEELRPEKVLSNFTRNQKVKSVEKTEKAVRRCAAFLAELYKLCEFEYIAKKVRPAFRRRRKSKEESQALVVQHAAPLHRKIIRRAGDLAHSNTHRKIIRRPGDLTIRTRAQRAAPVPQQRCCRNTRKFRCRGAACCARATTTMLPQDCGGPEAPGKSRS